MNKTSWPELLNSDKNSAIKIIETERPDLSIQVLSNKTAVASVFMSNRVIVRFNENDKVSSIPCVG